MAKLIYSVIASLDGCVADEHGKFDWAAPDEDVHAFVNDLERPVGTYLYGRRMYEVMSYWQTAATDAGQPAVTRDYAQLWQAADKIVYSTTLDAVTTPGTRLERRFDPAAVARLKDEATSDLSIGGPHLAAHAIRAGLVDEYRLLLVPVIVGGGTAALPAGVFATLTLSDVHRFGNGVIALQYRSS